MLFKFISSAIYIFIILVKHKMSSLSLFKAGWHNCQCCMNELLLHPGIYIAETRIKNIRQCPLIILLILTYCL